MRKIIITMFLFVSLLFSNKVYAYQLNDKITDDETIDAVNSLEITIKGKKVEIENFISSKWRTYVKLEDLCSEDIGICNIESVSDKEIKLTKQYENMDDVYYETIYSYENNTYDSKLIVPKTSNFNFGEVATTPDVKPVTVENKLYVPIRFVVEALGAEVIYDNSNKGENAKVIIDFYSNMNKVFNVSFTNDSREYNFSELEKEKCYDVTVDTGDEKIENAKLFPSVVENYKIDYNDDKKTNICINNKNEDDSLQFVFNYKNVPIIYTVNSSTINKNIEDNKMEEDNSIKRIDKIYIEGDTTSMSKENEVKAKVKYVGEATSFEKYVKMKWQGNSSLNYEKKGYSIKLYEDENYSEKAPIEIGDWPKLNKYVLKANYTDYTQARNVVSAQLWGDVVKTRKSKNEKLNNTVNGGAIDGYPVMLYINNQAQGLYTFNLPKTEKLFNMDGDNEYLVMSDGWEDDSLFKSATVDFDNKSSNWETIYTGNKSNDEIEKSINALIDFTIKNDNENFKNGISNYLDVDATIDYIIYMYYIDAPDNTSKNILWVTYDGTKWFPSMYDLDATFGNGNENFTFYETNTMLPKISDDGKTIESSTPNGMLLWTKMLNNFRSEIKTRYTELRKNTLTNEKVKERFEGFKKYINEENKKENDTKWPNLPNNKIDGYEQIYTYITGREKLLDDIINKF